MNYVNRPGNLTVEVHNDRIEDILMSEVFLTLE